MMINRTLKETEVLMESVVRLILKIPENDNGKIRIAYGANSKTGSAPVHNPQDSVCYIHVDPTDDGYGQQHHIKYINGKEIAGDMTEVDEYTEEFTAAFSLYGEDAYDQARKLRDGIYGIAIKEFLWGKHIHPKTGIPAIAQTHEIINTIWVNRCDLTVVFYSKVRIERENAVKNIEKVNIALKNDNKNSLPKEGD